VTLALDRRDLGDVGGFLGGTDGEDRALTCHP